MSKERDKGRRFEHEVAAYVEGVRTPMSGNKGEGDCIPGPLFEEFTVEAKCRANLSVDTWFEQARREAARQQKLPLLVLKRDRGKLLVVLDATDFKHLLRERRDYYDADQEEGARPSSLVGRDRNIPA